MARLVDGGTTESVPSLVELHGSNFAWLDQVVSRCLARDIADRWTSCDQLATLLRQRLRTAGGDQSGLRPLPEAVAPRRPPVLCESRPVNAAEEAQLEEGQRLVADGRLGDAIQSFKAALKCDPFSSAIARALRDAQAVQRERWCAEHLEQAKTALANDAYEDAIEHLQKTFLLSLDSETTRQLAATLSEKMRNQPER